jgi:hypothetical protein
MFDTLRHRKLYGLWKLGYEPHSGKTPNFAPGLINFVQHFFQNRHFGIWSKDQIVGHLSHFGSRVFSICHKDKFVLVSIRLEKFHKTRIIDDVIEI